MQILQQRALLARIVISRWTATKNDKRVAAEVDRAHSATDSGKFTKLLVDKAHTKALLASAGKIRQFHYSLTLPWDDDGDRLLPAKSLQKYNDGLRHLKSEDERLRREFYAVYPALVASAPKRLGTLYDPKDFPAVSELPSKYDVKILQKGVPDAKDFRVDVGNEATAQIKASITAENNAKFQQAMKDCYRRMDEVVGHISKTLKQEDPRIFKTLVTNARDLVECLPDLNLSDDPVLEQLRQDLHNMLPNSADAFKDNPGLRAKVADEADAILEKMKGML